MMVDGLQSDNIRYYQMFRKRMCGSVPLFDESSYKLASCSFESVDVLSSFNWQGLHYSSDSSGKM